MSEVPVTHTEFTVLNVPRGTPGAPPMALDMSRIYKAESRLYEIAHANPSTCPELMGFFNQSCNETSKYISWVQYEIIQANKALELAKAVVVLDKMPDAAKAWKEAGIKSNEDHRAAMIARDPDCQKAQDTLGMLQATKALLDGKFWSFMRAYESAKVVWERRSITPGPSVSMPVDIPNSIGGTGVGGQGHFTR